MTRCLPPPAAPVRDQAGPFFYSVSPLLHSHIVCVWKQTIAFHWCGWKPMPPQQHPNLNVQQLTQWVELIHMQETSTAQHDFFPAINKHTRNSFTYFTIHILSDMSQSLRSASAFWNLAMQLVGPGWCVHKLNTLGLEVNSSQAKPPVSTEALAPLRGTSELRQHSKSPMEGFFLSFCCKRLQSLIGWVWG